MSPKACPILGCGRPLTGLLMCRAHWIMVPAPLQKTIFLLWHNGKSFAGFEEACDSAVQQVSAKVFSAAARAHLLADA
jgi:hypothetical protein